MFEHVYVWQLYEKKFDDSRWPFSWLGKKVHIATAKAALTGGGDFGPRRIRPNCHVVSAC